MKSNSSLLFLALLYLFISSCKTEKLDHNYSGPEYFPLTVGKYKIYQVDSILYDDFAQTVDTVQSLVKHRIFEKFTDSSGDEAYFVIEERKGLNDSDWIESKVFTMKITPFHAQVYLDNIRWVKLSFPADKNKKWNGNMFNNEEEESYTYISVNEKWEGLFHSFNFTLEVLHRDILTLITENKGGEIYAQDVGLVAWYEIKTSTNGNKVGGFKVLGQILEYN